MDGNASLTVSQATTLVQTKISHLLFSAMKFQTDIHGAQRMNLADFVDLLTLLQAPMEVRRRAAVTFGSDIYGAQRMNPNEHLTSMEFFGQC